MGNCFSLNKKNDDVKPICQNGEVITIHRYNSMNKKDEMEDIDLNVNTYHNNGCFVRQKT